MSCPRRHAGLALGHLLSPLRTGGPPPLSPLRAPLRGGETLCAARAPESWPSVGGLASSVHAHRLALAQASGQELRAWDSAMRQSAP